MRKDLLSLITIDNDSAVPVYRQIVHSIRKNIDLGQLGLNDTLPSVNSIAAHFGMARGSVFSAYNDLRASGIIDSVPGKGYFITSTTATQIQKVFLLLDDFTPERSLLYKTIRQHLPTGTELCVFFHHGDANQFQTVIREKAAYHNAFIIIPTTDQGAVAALSGLDPKRLLILGGEFSSYQHNFNGLKPSLAKNLAELPSLISKQFLWQ